MRFYRKIKPQIYIKNPAFLGLIIFDLVGGDLAVNNLKQRPIKFYYWILYIAFFSFFLTLCADPQTLGIISLILLCSGLFLFGHAVFKIATYECPNCGKDFKEGFYKTVPLVNPNNVSCDHCGADLNA